MTLTSCPVPGLYASAAVLIESREPVRVPAPFCPDLDWVDLPVPDAWGRTVVARVPEKDGDDADMWIAQGEGEEHEAVLIPLSAMLPLARYLAGAHALESILADASRRMLAVLPRLGNARE